jgi:hypothetical protein
MIKIEVGRIMTVYVQILNHNKNYRLIKINKAPTHKS